MYLLDCGHPTWFAATIDASGLWDGCPSGCDGWHLVVSVATAQEQRRQELADALDFERLIGNQS